MSSYQDKVHPGNTGNVSLDLIIVQEYTTKSNTDYIEVSQDDSLWIGSAGKKKDRFFSFISYGNLQNVKLESDDLKIISSFNVDVRDIAITLSNDLFLADYTPKLKQVLYNANTVTESRYCMEPYTACSVHVTRNNQVVVGTLLNGEGGLYVMDINGVPRKIYRHDMNNKPLFKWPRKITSTSAGILIVIDSIAFETLEGRLVILDQGEIISAYTGHPIINSYQKPFSPSDVVSTSNDNIIVADTYNQTLHILDNTGRFLTFYNTQRIGIQYPYSLAFTMTGRFSILYIGGLSENGDGKLYKLILSGY